MMAEALGLIDETYRRYERGEAQPTLETLADIRRVTGISLDVLIAGQKPGSTAIVPPDEVDPLDITLGDRLRWVREAVMPNVAEAAELMRTDLATWQKWERSLGRPGVELMSEFAHRFGVSLDYLYRGVLTGMAPEVWEAVLALHPELRAEQPEGPASGSNSTRGNRKERDGDKRDPPISVVSLKPGK
jgi:transcriptional regulator with XRE-family HTH domain